MQLLRVELKGFKSFADKTTVQFSPGITAIVGPNGSGKSNITDAIKWVLGESNVRNIRGQKAEDVIFSGTDQRRAMNSAEVSIIFDNSDKQLENELEEVALTRRVYRSGESEFFINKRPCRMKDIYLLLADTGLGKDSMAIIGQNKVDSILNSKPEERRLIFEDIAGISKFKMNKADALRKMNATDRNMERVDDLLANMSEQVDGLKKKSDATHKYNELIKEKRQYDAVLAIHDFKTSERVQTRLENEKISLTIEQENFKKANEEKENEKNSLIEKIENQAEKIREYELEYSTMNQKIERLSGQRDVLLEKERALVASKQEKNIRLDELKITITSAENRLALIEKSLKDDIEAKQLGEEEFLAISDKLKTADNNWTNAKKQWENQINDKKQSQERANQLVSLIERSKAEIGLVNSQIEDTNKILEDVQAETKEVQSELDNKIAEKNKLAEKKIKYEANLNNDKEELNTLAKRYQFLDQELNKIENENTRNKLRLEILENSEEQHEGYTQAVKAIMTAKKDWNSNIFGPVGDLFKVKDEFSTAIDIALGASIHNIVCKEAKKVGLTINYLKENKRGRATFMPLDSIKPRFNNKQYNNEEGIIALASECIEYDEKYDNVFKYLLGRTIVAKNLDAATNLQKKNNGTLRIVTLNGEILQPGGSITGGSVKPNRGNVMKRKQEITELKAKTTELKTIYDEKLNEKNSLEKEVAKIKLSLEEKTAVIETELSKINVLNNTIIVLEEKKSRKERVYNELLLKQGSLKSKEEAGNKELNEYIAEEKELASRTYEESALINLDKLNELQEEYQKQHELYTQIRLEQEQKTASIKRQEEEKTIRYQELENAKEKVDILKLELEKITNELEKIIPQSKIDIEQEIQTTQSKNNELNTTREKLYEKHKEDQQVLKEIRTNDDKSYQRTQEIQSRLIELEGSLTKVKLDAEQALQKVTDLGYSKSEAENIELEGKVADWKETIAKLNRKIQSLGIVNPNSIQEYEEALARKEFLEEQQSDLLLAKGQLETVIEEIDKAMSDQFLEVFEIVSKKFQEIFVKLFEGGKARLVLTDKENILETGIDMLIQPPGKSLKQLSLLSGGERSLTVIALLFAFLAYRPAPFTVLDEVDAALDEANVERFSSFLGKLADEIQFIVVTHRKNTMESAKVLHGVTMAEQGISKMLSVKFEDIEEDLI